MGKKKALIALLPAVIIAIVLIVLFVHKKVNNKNELVETEC